MFAMYLTYGACVCFFVTSLAGNTTIQDITALVEKKEYNTAAHLCYTLLSQYPNDCVIRNVLGDIHLAQNNAHEACKQWELVLKYQPDDIDVRIKLADAYAASELFDPALLHYKHTLKHKNARTIQTLFKYATTHLKIGNIDQALETFHAITNATRNPISVLYNIGYTLKVAGRIDEALSYYDKVIALQPTYDAAYLARGFALLQKGDFVNGWKQHERYLKSANKNADKLRTLLAENNIAGKHLVFTYEGGLGDTLMFIRYVERFKQMGAYITCIVQKPLISLLSHNPYIDQLRTLDQGYPKSYDASATLMTLPALFYETEETIPRNIPYIQADPALITYWHDKIPHDSTLKIGICWQADVYNDSSRLPIARRGMPLLLLQQLMKHPHIHVYSLQRFDGVEQIKNIPHDCRLHVFENMDTTHGSFMDTAAIIDNLDLIISTDTAMAHLAGAMGKSVLLLLPYSTDWRWICERHDSPWYPTMRIFKQTRPFDWEGVVQEVYTYLTNMYGVSL